MITILYNRKSVGNFNFSLVFDGKINSNFYYKKTTEKKYDNFREKYKNVFKILKLCKAFSNFDFSSAIREKIEWVLQLFGNNFSLTSQAGYPNSFINILI